MGRLDKIPAAPLGFMLKGRSYGRLLRELGYHAIHCGCCAGYSGCVRTHRALRNKEAQEWRRLLRRLFRLLGVGLGQNRVSQLLHRRGRFGKSRSKGRGRTAQVAALQAKGANVGYTSGRANEACCTSVRAGCLPMPGFASFETLRRRGKVAISSRFYRHCALVACKHALRLIIGLAQLKIL